MAGPRLRCICDLRLHRVWNSLQAGQVDILRRAVGVGQPQTLQVQGVQTLVALHQPAGGQHPLRVHQGVRRHAGAIQLLSCLSSHGTHATSKQRQKGWCPSSKRSTWCTSAQGAPAVNLRPTQVLQPATQQSASQHMRGLQGSRVHDATHVVTM